MVAMRVAVLWGAGSWRQFCDLVDCFGGCGLVDGSLVDGGLVVGCLEFAYVMDVPSRPVMLAFL